MRADRVLRRVRRVLPGLLDGGLLDVVADTGGAGLCRDASADLVAAVGRGRLVYFDFETNYASEERDGRDVGPMFPLPRWTRRYWRAFDAIADSGHVVAEIDGFYVDVTARQFRRRLPFPMIVPVATP